MADADLWHEEERAPLLCAGVDEAGRGPLAGPVIAAAVILDANDTIADLRDSKRLDAETRERLFDDISRHALAVGVGRADALEIDRINILRATLVAMQRAVGALGVRPEVVYVDGNVLPHLDVPSVAIVGGDDLHAAISAASIIAKVTRDREMAAIARRYPGYGFEQHKGYATLAHLDALARLGPSPIHRRSFAPLGARHAQDSASLFEAT